MDSHSSLFYASIAAGAHVVIRTHCVCPAEFYQLYIRSLRIYIAKHSEIFAKLSFARVVR
jgi:hypothetical protein